MPDAVTALGVRRYGFHGLSVQHVVDTVPGSAGRWWPTSGGAAASPPCVGGRSVQTSMSFSPTGGLPSVSRSGDLDPEILLFLADRGWTTADLRGLVDRSSGLAGMSGGLTDVAELTRRAAAGDPDCRWPSRRSPPPSPRPWPATPLSWVAWTRSCSPVGSASTPPRSGMRSPSGWATSASRRPGGAGARGHQPVRRPVRTVVVTADEERVMDRSARTLLAPALDGIR